jgi:hypothetical protein
VADTLTAEAVHNAIASVTAAYGAALMDKNREIALLKQQVDALKHAVEELKKVQTLLEERAKNPP